MRHLSLLAGPPGLFYYTEADMLNETLSADVRSEIASADRPAPET